MTRGVDVYRDVAIERLRAHNKHVATGRSCEEVAFNDPLWMPILVEEIGEVAEEITTDSKLMQSFLDEVIQAGKTARMLCDIRGAVTGIRIEISSLAHLREELIQVAAMSTAFADSISDELAKYA